jgi:hypothetical protein
VFWAVGTVLGDSLIQAEQLPSALGVIACAAATHRSGSSGHAG